MPVLAAARKLSKNRLVKLTGLSQAKVGDLLAENFDAQTSAERSRFLEALGVTPEQLEALQLLCDRLLSTQDPAATVPIPRASLEGFLAAVSLAPGGRTVFDSVQRLS